MGAIMIFKVGFAAIAVSLLLSGASGTASAADMGQPVYKAPMVAPGFNWTGLYIGAVAGYGWGEANGTPTGALSGALDSYRTKPDGWLVGGTVGYNYQQGNIVLGTEGEFYWSDLDGSANVNPF